MGDEERWLALRLLQNIRYFTLSSMQSWCQALHTRLRGEVEVSEASFISLGGPAKSGEVIARYYYSANGIDDSRFVRERDLPALLGRGRTFVLLDDFIGTGRQMTRLGPG